MGLGIVKAYYYLTPLWCALEVVAWPGLRSGPMTAGSPALVCLFFTVEGAVAGAFWLRFWAAEHVAFFENSVYLLSAAGLLLQAPMSLIKSWPGMAFSLFQVSLGLYRLAYRRRLRRA